jgi:hypothetical protein
VNIKMALRSIGQPVKERQKTGRKTPPHMIVFEDGTEQTGVIEYDYFPPATDCPDTHFFYVVQFKGWTTYELINVKRVVSIWKADKPEVNPAPVWKREEGAHESDRAGSLD